MRTWQPLVTYSKSDRFALAEKTERAILVLTDKVSPKHNEQVTTVMRQLRAHQVHEGSALVHSQVFHWYFKLVEAIKASDLPKIEEHLESVTSLPEKVFQSLQRADETKETIGLPIDLDTTEDSIASSLDRVKRATSSLSPDAVVHLEVVPPDKQILNSIKEAITLLRETWPDIYEEMQCFLQKMVLFKGKGIVGFTDFRYHGCIFVYYECLVGAETFDIAQEILHEASHVRLNGAMAVAPMILNDESERYPSPLRRDPRPMIGLFQQMYVLARLYFFFKSLVPTQGEKIAAILAETSDQLKMAYSVVEQYGKLTPAGQELVDSIGKLVKSLEVGTAHQYTTTFPG